MKTQATATAPTETRKTGYFLGLNNNPNAYGYGKTDGMVNLGEVWEDAVAGEEIDVEDFNHNPIGTARLLHAPNSNIVSIEFVLVENDETRRDVLDLRIAHLRNAALTSDKAEFDKQTADIYRLA